MIKPTSRNINILSILITGIILIIISIIHSFWVEHDQMKFEVSFNSPISQEIISAEAKNDVINEETKEEADNDVISKDAKEEAEKSNINEKTNEENWIIEIPEINLHAQISEGTTKEVMDQFVGHFEETKIEYGNVGLAAHNRGYPVNYFHDIKKLKEGSEIIYKHNDYYMTYVVDTIEIIENTNWEYLKNTEDNRITLITCVENEPKYRRCIQGVEKIESEEY